MKSDKEFVLNKEKEFQEAYGEVLTDLGQLLSGDNDFPKYERMSWAIRNLDKMVQAFEQVMAGYYNQWNDEEVAKKNVDTLDTTSKGVDS